MNLFLLIFFVAQDSTALPGTTSSQYLTTEANVRSSEAQTDSVSGSSVTPMGNQEYLGRNLSLCEPAECICCPSELKDRCCIGSSVADTLGIIGFVLSLLALVLNAIFIYLYLQRPTASLNTGNPDKKKVQFHGDGDVYENISRHTVCGQAYTDLHPVTKQEQEYATLSPMSVS